MFIIVNIYLLVQSTNLGGGRVQSTNLGGGRVQSTNLGEGGGAEASQRTIFKMFIYLWYIL